MTGGTNIFGEWTTNIAAEQLNQRHLEVCVKTLEDSVYRDRDTYHIGGDWTMPCSITQVQRIIDCITDGTSLNRFVQKFDIAKVGTSGELTLRGVAVEGVLYTTTLLVDTSSTVELQPQLSPVTLYCSIQALHRIIRLSVFLQQADCVWKASMK